MEVTHKLGTRNVYVSVNSFRGKLGVNICKYIETEGKKFSTKEFSTKRARYNHLLDQELGTNTLYHDRGNQITREDFPAGYALFALDLSPDLAAGPHVSATKRVTLLLGIQFAEGLQATVNCIIYAELDSRVEIDANRNVMQNCGSLT
ncbi:predicted protein [Nematostella vectensis]|uniref:Uncharacterized protein n=1 Tax=Nematostella vectensis TaxID=45351 RepID=A7RS34_NEMVE|nr:predicted protein [Nematostella vectensis]|eukprot:XP_001637799.1 predicted protein [Nematostella vectensis]